VNDQPDRESVIESDILDEVEEDDGGRRLEESFG
jgi:hypothetical protein